MASPSRCVTAIRTRKRRPPAGERARAPCASAQWHDRDRAPAVTKARGSAPSLRGVHDLQEIAQRHRRKRDIAGWVSSPSCHVAPRWRPRHRRPRSPGTPAPGPQQHHAVGLVDGRPDEEIGRFTKRGFQIGPAFHLPMVTHARRGQQEKRSSISPVLRHLPDDVGVQE